LDEIWQEDVKSYRKTANIIVKKNLEFTTPFHCFQGHPQTRRSKTANITKDDITSQRNDILAM